MSASGCDCEADAAERRTLAALFGINAAMFAVELAAGWLAESTALIADAFDMFADASIYAISLLAVGGALSRKVRAARLSGIAQMTLGAAVFIDVARRALFGSDPEPTWMLLVGLAALAANVACLLLISRYREGEVHLRASWICSRNDVVANFGVLAGGGLVLLTGSRWPDLVIGLAIAALVVRGGAGIVREARSTAEGAG